MVRRQKDERGFVLLVVLTLLTIFTLMAATFLVVAGNYRVAATAASRVGPQQPPPQQLTDEVMFTMLVDTNDPQSVIRGHSFLRDMYGDDGFTAIVSASSRVVLDQQGQPLLDAGGQPIPLAGGQFLDVFLATERSFQPLLDIYNDPSQRDWQLGNSILYPHTYSGQWLELSPTAGYYNGCVLSFVSGPLSGMSTRIIEYSPLSPAGLAAFPNAHATNSRFRLMPIDAWPASVAGNINLNLAQSRVVVNGRPFSGSGFGYLQGVTQPAALQPNQATAQRLNRQNGVSATFEFDYLSAGADESYDAPDFQNMHLAALAPDPNDPSRLWVLPSFHRPKLIGQTPLAFQQAASLRPPHVTLDPNSTFDGSNPDFPIATPQTPFWDVDNDGDGIRDSIWLDAGLPIQTDSEGRRFKPLAAILCLDLDSRLNVNAQGAGQVVNPGRYPTDLAGNPDLSPLPPTDATAVNASVRRPAAGVGTGPADVDLRVALGDAAYDMLWQQQTAEGLAGAPGVDFSTAVRAFERLEADLKSERMVGLDHRGQPSYTKQAAPVADHPYEKNLLTPSGADRLFTVSELEGLLRFYDDDVTSPRVVGPPFRLQSTPGRLTASLPNPSLANLFVPAPSDPLSILRAARNRRLVTTHSFDLPVPNIAPPVDLIVDENGVSKWFHHVSALLRERLIDGLGLVEPLSPAEEQAINVEIEKMLSRDLMMGLRMDINRPFGNGLDDNGNGVRDEPFETGGTVEPIWNGIFPNVSTPVPFDTVNARTLYARHLYVLAMMLTDQNALADGITPPEVSRALAQWAVNAVDFRDSDSIMTRFDFDLQPFNGWQPNEVVWGAERPEMLITETLAYHNLRTKDTDVGGTVQQGDEDFDQVNRPLGSFYVELYNPWTDTIPLDPAGAELYELDNVNQKRGLRLDKRVPSADPSAASSPIWRLVVAPQLGDIDRQKLQFSTDDPEVSVIYLGCSRSPELVQDAGVDYPSATVQNPEIVSTPGRPSPFGLLGGGEYAIVGTVRDSADLTGVNPIVRVNPDDAAGPGNNSRWISLSAGPVPQIRVIQSSDDTYMPVEEEVRPVAVAIPIERLNISEDPGYDTVEIDSKLDLDQPLGYDEREKVVHLQRLANPLLEWHPASNPYLTVDSMPVDLVVFNGPGPNLEGQAEAFYAVQRGRPEELDDTGNLQRLLWKQNRPNPPAATAELISEDDATVTSRFNRRLEHTLGSLNATYGISVTRGAAANDGLAINTRTYVNVPAAPFPWLTWFNRPFTSQYELQLVPRSSSFNLLRDWGLRDKTRNLSNPVGLEKIAGEFPHLLNFYWSGGGLPQLFDFTHVPSQFAGTETVLNPAGVVNQPEFVHLQPPFNRISNYREPGKTNLNTAPDRAIIDAMRGAEDDDTDLTAVTRGVGPRFFQVVASRTGALDPSPTFFSNPFRRFGGTTIPGTTLPPVESTLLRSFGNTRLFSAERLNLAQFYKDPDRNPYFRYEPLQRFANLVTTRSNVYAVWITIGFFEVEDLEAGGPIDAPQGYRLGAEVGWDTGDIRRHRAFYVIDRSIPVAFEPGKRHNAADTILLRRFIE